MSLASKVTLGCAVTFTTGMVAYVHLKQQWDREVRRKMHKFLLLHLMIAMLIDSLVVIVIAGMTEWMKTSSSFFHHAVESCKAVSYVVFMMKDQQIKQES